ncbi:MAG TPA: BMP family ABC transporter substrate-binding protein [Gaiellaceae bacterium]|nr:BMP family ABC transporter substrate-binding protein [Gaiellaceae bacterium]
MRGRRTAIGAVLALAVVAAMVVSSAGASPKQEFKMAIFTDIGTLQDRSFNQLANEGRIAVGKQLGIQTRVYQTKKEAERIPNGLAAGRAGYNLIFGVGFLNYTAINAVAPRFPNQQFAGIDQPYVLYAKKPKNATGVVFAEHEAGYLVGYLAALQLKSQGGPQIISAVGANNVPAIVKYISGYIQGAKKANPRIRVLANYANDPTFSDQAKCKETALSQIQKGSRAIFQVAGGCGLGALTAAKQAKIWGIGVDADQLYLGSHMLTSALKRVDNAVIAITKLAEQGKLKSRRDYLYSLKNNGVGLGSVNKKVKKSFVAKTNAIGKQIGAGKIKVRAIIKFKAVN